ncbi:hypothetical protein V7075_03285 [Neobacillus drentensis]|uniref:hypothetical protein n=1 Tax=Neobacillus drentensis TaxID=220684 RepID=UPI002FFEDA7E
MTIISVVCVPEGIAMTADSRLIGTYTRDNGVVEWLSALVFLIMPKSFSLYGFQP